MISTTAPDVYTDIQGLSRLKLAAKENTPESVRAVAEQFEALFTQMILKNMRNSNLGDGIFDSDQSKQYQDMFDKQLSLDMSKKGGLGIADMLVRQLGGKDIKPSASNSISINSSAPVSHVKKAEPINSPDEFIKLLGPSAQKTADKLGVPVGTLLAQAALETGWGKSIIKHPYGQSSHNLFGIKADSSWQGASVKSTTIEFENGIAEKKSEMFRSYSSYEESFEDYASFLKASPRYSEALEQAHNPVAYTQALQDAGYATDPLYAKKIRTIMQGELLTQALASLDAEVAVDLKNQGS